MVIELATAAESREPVQLWRPRPLYKSPMPRTFKSYGPEVCAWIETHCVYPAGEWLGRPFKLLPWQRSWINELYAVDDDGTLQFRWALLGLPKKNGKTALAAALSLYHVAGDPDENDPWAVCAATSSDQADLVYGAASRMVEYSESLTRYLRVYRKEIRYRDDNTPGKLERVAASKGKLDGKNISFLVCDELHEWDRENWTILTNGTIGRRRAQIIQITTAGYDLETVCGEEYIKGVAISDGEIENKTYLMRWYGAEDNDSHRDPAVWRGANPGYGTLVTEQALNDKMENIGENEFRRYNLNQWTGAEEVWLDDGMWEACAGRINFRSAQPVFVGWDASTKRDSTAVVAVQFEGDYEDIIRAVQEAQAEAMDGTLYDRMRESEDEQERQRAIVDALLHSLDTRLHVYGKIWERPLDPRTGKPVENWRVPIGEVEGWVRSLCEEFPVKEIAYDPAFITWSAIGLEAQGIAMVEFPQTDSRMMQATQTTYELIMLGKIVHNDDAQQNRQINNTATSVARTGGTRVAKGKTRKPMDFSVGLVMAVQRAVMSLLNPDESGGGVW